MVGRYLTNATKRPPAPPRYNVGAIQQVKGGAPMGVFDLVEQTGHEQVLYGYDECSGLKTIIAIHSTALGPALGGLRFYPYESEQDALTDVLRLSKGMSYKAAAAGLDLGGGKAVIIGDSFTDKSERLFRAYGRIVDSLRGRYITAEDVGTTAKDMELIRRETMWAVGIPIPEGGSGDPSPATARGLFSGLTATSEFLWNTPDLSGRRVAVQGVGKVGYYYVEHLVNAGCEVIVADTYGPAVDRVTGDFGVKAVDPEEILFVDCDVLSPCALGASLTEETIPKLSAQVIAGAANNQLATDEDGDRIAAMGILYAPDFVVNAGGLINVFEEMRGYQESRAMHHVDSIHDATTGILEKARNEGTIPHVAAVQVAEERMKTIGDLRRFRRHGEDRN